MNSRVRWASCFLALSLCSGCGSDAPDGDGQTTARPVAVTTLSRTAPAAGRRIMGVAQPYRQEEVGFMVGGRVAFVEDLGRELRGPQLDEQDRVIEGAEGQRIGLLDMTRYEQAFEAAQLKLASAKAGLDANQIEADMAGSSDVGQTEARLRVAEQDVLSAQSSFDLAKTELERTRELFEGKNASQSELDNQQSAFDRANATLESARQNKVAAAAALASAQAAAKLASARVDRTKAEVAELEQALEQARQDLEDSVLRAPFSGRITAVHVGRGGYVQPGSSVVTLTAMDPMQVSITVGAEQSRQLIEGAQVSLYPRDLDRFNDAGVLYGFVFGKPEVADAATRTYRVDIMVRNLLHGRDVSEEIDGRRVHGIEDLMPVLKEQQDDDGPIYVGTDSILREGDDEFVLLIPGLTSFERRRDVEIDSVFTPKKIKIQRGPRRLTFVNFKFVEVLPGPELQEGNVLIRDPRSEHVEGVRLMRSEWAIRPGDLVPVAVDGMAGVPGFYVPVQAVSSVNDTHYVFVIEGGRARRIEVSVHESAGDTRRIESEELAEGAQLVVEGVHYLADGDTAQIVDSIF